MRLANWVVQGVVVATFLALLLAPEKWGSHSELSPLGSWEHGHCCTLRACLAGPKQLTRALMLTSASLWWVPRLIGGFFVAFALVIALFSFYR